MSDPKLSEDLAAGHLITMEHVNRADALEHRLAEAEKLAGLAPDPEIAEAVKIVEAMMGDFGLPEHETAALNMLINRASGVTVEFMRRQLREANEQVSRCLEARAALRADAEAAGPEVET